MKDHYGFDIVEISDLNNIADQPCHYKYESIDFYYNRNTNIKKYLIVSFHGGIYPTTPIPVFRSYNLKYDNADILSISDRLVEQYYGKVALGWFLSTTKHDYDAIYTAIIAHIGSKYDDIIFFGTSGGGFPSLYYACKFRQICLIGNPQIYLEKFQQRIADLNKILENDNDNLIQINIEEYMINNPPKYIYYSINQADNHHYNVHAMPFFDFCARIDFTNLNNMTFDTKHDNPHSIVFESCYNTIIRSIFNKKLIIIHYAISISRI